MERHWWQSAIAGWELCRRTSLIFSNGSINPRRAEDLVDWGWEGFCGYLNDDTLVDKSHPFLDRLLTGHVSILSTNPRYSS